MSNYDWPYIRMRYEAGESAYILSKRMGGKPSKQGIMKRAAKEEWEQGEKEDEELPVRLPIVAAALNIDSRIMTDELLRIILGMIGSGSTEKLACQAAGINQNTWTNWKKQDERLQDAVNRARAGKLGEWIGRIDRASEKDWKAAQALLQAAPETRDDFGKGDQKGSRIEIVIHVDRNEGVTIDGKAQHIPEHVARQDAA